MAGKSGKVKENNRILATNRKAFHDYTILSKLEVGIVLHGTEVKVVRSGGVSLTGAYVHAEGFNLWLLQANFPPYDFGNRFNHDTLRPRRLLAHKKEILKLRSNQEQKGLTIVPLKMYLSEKGKVKLELGVAKGKGEIDKRESIKRRELDRDARRAMASSVRR